jgi:hypothetical protein
MESRLLTSSELDNDVEGFATHLAKHFSFVFYAMYMSILSFVKKIARLFTFMSSCALAKAISFLTVFIMASFRAA